jgi:hypothetical protein
VEKLPCNVYHFFNILIAAIGAIIANLPPSVQNLYLDCAAVAMQTANNPYPVHICPIIRKHGLNLKSLFLSCRFLVRPISSFVIVVSRSLSSRSQAELATSRRSSIFYLPVITITVLPRLRIFHNLQRRKRSLPLSQAMFRNVSLWRKGCPTVTI